MGAVQCCKCDQVFNAKVDPECYVEKPNYTNTANPVNPAFKERTEWIVVCESCREDEAA